MFKNKIFNHFYLEFFKIFLIISLSLSILIWVTQAARLLDLITEYGNSTNIYLKYVLYSYPKIFNNIFLLSFSVSIFFTIAKIRSSNELSIYWLSGISKLKIANIILSLSLFLVLINLILSIYLAPASSYKGRIVLANAKFSLINSLVKENNFNSPLKNLTIYVNNNDKKGNLFGVFIYEKNRTIIAKRGMVYKVDDKSYLKLFDGTTQEIVKSKINIIKFKNTIFDFSQYEIQNMGHPKFSERDIIWLLQNINSKILKNSEIREEINKRIIKPFLILILATFSCFLLYSNNEKISSNKIKLIVYLSSFVLIIFNQILIGLSGKNILYTSTYLLIICLLFIFTFFQMNKFLKK